MVISVSLMRLPEPVHTAARVELIAAKVIISAEERGRSPGKGASRPVPVAHWTQAPGLSSSSGRRATQATPAVGNELLVVDFFWVLETTSWSKICDSSLEFSPRICAATPSPLSTSLATTHPANIYSRINSFVLRPALPRGTSRHCRQWPPPPPCFPHVRSLRSSLDSPRRPFPPPHSHPSTRGVWRCLYSPESRSPYLRYR